VCFTKGQICFAFPTKADLRPVPEILRSIGITKKPPSVDLLQKHGLF
jgi:hypothetical protein